MSLKDLDVSLLLYLKIFISREGKYWVSLNSCPYDYLYWRNKLIQEFEPQFLEICENSNDREEAME